MIVRWTNGVLAIGPLYTQDSYGISVAWGRRDLMGEEVRQGESLFADHKTIVLCSGYEAYVYGSVRKAIVNRLLRKVFGT
jgi:hypothetical protein